MSSQVVGNTKGLAAAELKALLRLYRRRLERDEVLGLDLARELYSIAEKLNRAIAVLVGRDGRIESVIVGSKQRIYIPDLGRYRLGQGRLRRLRLIFTDLSNSSEAEIPQDIYTDLEKLRLDLVVSIKSAKNRIGIQYAHLLPAFAGSEQRPIRSFSVKDLSSLDINFQEFIEELESEIDSSTKKTKQQISNSAILIGVYPKDSRSADSSMTELKELARTAGVEVLDAIIQRKAPDPRTVLGKGKLEEVVLQCLRLGAEMIIFDCELRPTQWRALINSTELKVLDRSMLILDIFAQRASSADGRLQVELAQLSYNLPRLVEFDTGLSRLSGGIGGRGPGETKLELGRRRIRDKISELKIRIEKLAEQRELRRETRRKSGIPVVALVGYTNVGKSTLFNALTASSVFVENKLFATLDPSHRRLRFPYIDKRSLKMNEEVILTDTVGFIRELPKELVNAFKASLEVLEEADLLIHVLDASDPEILNRKAAVEGILADMGLADIAQMVVLNKADLVAPEVVQDLARSLNALVLSASLRLGLKDLLVGIQKKLLLELEKNELISKSTTDDLEQDLSTNSPR